ncbi:hypothetical protein D3C87_301020 [compost metagenome]
MSTHRLKGFSQTTKHFDSSLKAQQLQKRNKQMDHSGDTGRNEEERRANSKEKDSESRKGR